MLKYLIIHLDDTATSFCHYDNNATERKLMALDLLKKAIVRSMKENLMVQFVCPDSPLPEEYKDLISEIDHISIVSSGCEDMELLNDADIIVINDWDALNCIEPIYDQTYVIRTTLTDLLKSKSELSQLLSKVSRINIVIKDVGTEIARSLAKEMGIRLIRFDMSEYEEKHAVAKLIGAPAGYVGYEEGGLLTEEIRKNPHAVLLLDEIEKAHSDIYNILLQVMDYATLTDNQGRKADFRNVIVIMTSNAGANRIGKHRIGFGEQDIKEEAIMEEVKRIFQPEFRNRLNRIVVFHGMDDEMAGQVVEKKLKELAQMLVRKNVELSVSKEAKKLVKRKGISTEFGAREIERVIQGEIKPLLVDEILFGELKEGGRCELTANGDQFKISLLSKGNEG